MQINLYPKRRRLGVPYQGSKNAIARDIISILPSGNRFVDLFAGGCAMTHAAILSGKYKTFLANDIQGFGIRLFIDAIKGKCNGKWREWVTREEFNAKKNIDPLISLCWSFSNNGRDYLYAREKERAKFEEHQRRIRGEKNTHSQGTRQCEALERLQALERLEHFDTSYDAVELKNNDVVYCDPPYKNTQKYNSGSFDSDAFWAWCDKSTTPIFVSEYSAPDGFRAIWTKGKQRLMNQKGSDGYIAEYVFVQERYAKEFQTDLFL